MGPLSAAAMGLATVAIAVWMVGPASAEAREGWEPGIRLVFGEGTTLGQPTVVLDPTGNATIAWTRQDWSSGETQLMVQRFNFNTGLGSAPIPLARGDPQYSEFAIACDDQGRVILAWVTWEANRSALWASRYEVGAGWSKPQALGDPEVGYARLPSLALNKNGSGVLAWREWINNSTLVRARSFDPPSGWRNATDLYSSMAIEHATYSTTVDAGGIGHVVWAHGGNLSAARYLPSQGWSARESIVANTFAVGSLRIAADPTGQAMVVWEQAQDIYNRTIDAAFFSSTRGWQPATTLSLRGQGQAQEPWVGADAYGDFLALWGQFPTGAGPEGIVAAWHTPGNGWSPPTSIENATGHAWFQTIALDRLGNAFVVFWQQVDCCIPQPGTGNIDVRSIVYRTGAGWGENKSIAPGEGGDGFLPRVSADGRGNAIAVWGDYQYIAISRYFGPRDTTPPVLRLSGATNGSTVNASSITLSGVVEPWSKVTVDGGPVWVSPDGRFQAEVPLTEGVNRVALEATDPAGNIASVSYVFIRASNQDSGTSPPPPGPSSAPQETLPGSAGALTVSIAAVAVSLSALYVLRRRILRHPPP
jgi:hypothetical protein